MARDKRIGMRLSEGEYVEVLRRSGRLGLSITDYLLKVVRDEISGEDGEEGVSAESHNDGGEGGDSEVESEGVGYAEDRGEDREIEAYGKEGIEDR